MRSARDISGSIMVLRGRSGDAIRKGKQGYETPSSLELLPIYSNERYEYGLLLDGQVATHGIHNSGVPATMAQWHSGGMFRQDVNGRLSYPRPPTHPARFNPPPNATTTPCPDRWVWSSTAHCHACAQVGPGVSVVEKLSLVAWYEGELSPPIWPWKYSTTKQPP